MNNYVVFDTLKYKAPHRGFSPIRSKPVTERLTLSGASDVTYGPGAIVEWTGELLAPVTPEDTGYGDIDDLRFSLEKREALAFINHYNEASTVYAIGPHGEDSFSPRWDAASNEFRITVRFVVDQAGGALVPMATLFLDSTVPSAIAAGGEVTISMNSITLESSAVHAFPSIPIALQELYLASSANMEGVPQVVVMDELTLASSIPAMTVT